MRNKSESDSKRNHVETQFTTAARFPRLTASKQQADTRRLLCGGQPQHTSPRRTVAASTVTHNKRICGGQPQHTSPCLTASKQQADKRRTTAAHFSLSNSGSFDCDTNCHTSCDTASGYAADNSSTLPIQTMTALTVTHNKYICCGQQQHTSPCVKRAASRYAVDNHSTLLLA